MTSTETDATPVSSQLETKSSFNHKRSSWQDLHSIGDPQTQQKLQEASPDPIQKEYHPVKEELAERSYNQDEQANTIYRTMEVISARNKSAQQVAMSQEIRSNVTMIKTNESAPAAMQKGYKQFVDESERPKEEREMTITEEEEREVLNGDEE